MSAPSGPDGAATLPAAVLIVDDEQAFASVLGSYFDQAGYRVSYAHDGPAAVAAAELTRPDLVLLDLMLPGFDGLEVCRRIRTFSDAYVLMLTARDDDIDKIVGLSVGADDYVVKPASPRELLARAAAMLRRPRGIAGAAGTAGEDEPVVRLGDLVVDPNARTVTVRGAAVELTRLEFDLLAAMAARPRVAFTRGQLITAVWGPDWYGDEHLVDVHIGHLRRKLGDDPAAPRYVRTVRGIGYGLGSGAAR